MFSPPTSPDTPRSICSAALGGGRTPSSLPDGPQIVPSGRVRARASRSRSQDAAQAPVTQGTYGPTCFASSVPPGPLSCWESRLRERLAMAGSTEFPLIWKEQVTPAGRSISRLAPSTRRTSAAGYTGALWPTPTVADVQGGRMTRSGARNDEPLLNGLMTWSTPRASDGEKGGPNQSFGAGGTPLPAQMHTAAWSTPTTNDARNNAAPSQFERNSAALNVQMAAATWPTPLSTPSRGGENRGSGTGTPAIGVLMAAASGTTTPSLPATTVRRGVPNPQFPCWLMGFPAVWLLGVASGTPSSHRSPPK